MDLVGPRRDNKLTFTVYRGGRRAQLFSLKRVKCPAGEKGTEHRTVTSLWHFSNFLFLFGYLKK